MSAKFEFVPATMEHCFDIAPRMRAADAFECLAMVGLQPLEGIAASMGSSDATTVLMDGRPELMFGTSEINTLAGQGLVWLLGTDAISLNRRKFLRYTREFRSILFARYKTLRNAVWEENKTSIRWLEWLGAEFFDEAVYFSGYRFLVFELRK
ncbi:phage protein Gp13 family protein [Pleomorphomonas oryzae]|uniref:phage protein Gp13 family protein n=1 Tax=Pleomorphomonas oryzae TaxID=261934 RepID=UPI00047C1E53|nr:phage protein Gp13 family protein [Pleomorphomonas oryzae]